MEEPPRTRPHTVTTTASSFAENFSTSSSSFAYDREFLRTAPGLLIVAEIVSPGPGGGRGAGGGRRRGTGARASAGSQRRSADGPFRSVSPSSQSGKLRDPLSERGPVILGKRLVTLRMSVGGETQLAGGPLWVMEARPGSWMAGEPGVYVNESP